MKWPTIHFVKRVAFLATLPSPEKDVLVGAFAISVHSTYVLHLDAPPLLDDLIRLGFEPYHGRQVGRNCVGSPNIGMNDPIKRPTKLFYGTKASKRIFVS